ncbi:RasGEF domain containing protein [Histomonas meleagridis]|nr:RasGEF domain containing protein [Histomonas meleagridis]
MNSNAIFRLKHHLESLPENVMEPIHEILDAIKSDDNFAKIRNIHDEGQKSGPCLPYIGVYLTQLTFFYDGNKDYIDDLVNYNKCIGIFKLIDKIQSFQIKQFNFVVIEQIQEKLSEIVMHDESELYAKSLSVEPGKVTAEEFEQMRLKERAEKGQ